jgi:hypothetical protein
MSVNKKYQALNRQSLIMVVQVPGTDKTMTIEFKNGYGLQKDGYFLTNDPVIQDILEKDKRFKDVYALVEIDNVGIAEYNARKELGLDANNKPEAEEKPQGDGKKLFVNAQAAKDWLNAEHGVPFNAINNKTKVIEKAKELGFDIAFESDNKQ